MIIALTGTPGTGKTAVAKLLAKSMKAGLIDIKKEAALTKHTYDKKRKSKEIDTVLLQRAIDKKISASKSDIILLEGHLSHFLKSDIIIILRTDPAVLEKRLKKRHWNREKIRENIEAEILDVITIESLAKPSKLMEINTSKMTPKKCADAIMRLIEKPANHKKYAPGKVDWTEKYMHILIKKPSKVPF
ncbi:MAG TPA: adenylate kinase family protein [archaeon]|nr:adenylate kinase family protein [archaeon]